MWHFNPKIQTMYKFIIALFLISTFASAQKQDNCKTNMSRNFKLIKEEGLKIDTTVAKVKGFYLSKDSFLDLDQKWKDRFSYMRFFENGKVYKSCTYLSFPTKADLEDLSYGFYSEYKVEDGRIVIESFAPSCGYLFEYYIIHDNTIIRIGTSKRKFNTKLNMKPSPSTVSYEYQPN